MPPRRRKKPPNPTPLSLPFTSLFKKNPSVLECQLLGHISQFIDLGKIVGLASNSASISGRFSRPLSSTVQRLGNYSSFQWRFLSLDRSTSVLLVVGGDFACYGCGRTLRPSSVPVIWTRGPGSATVKSNTPGRLAGLRSDGCLVALLLHLQKGSYCVTVHNRPEWPLPTVSTHFRLLIFRSGFQPLESGLQFSQWADHVYLGLMLDVCTSTPFVQLALRTSCVTNKAQHDSKCDMCRRYSNKPFFSCSMARQIK